MEVAQVEQLAAAMFTSAEAPARARAEAALRAALGGNVAALTHVINSTMDQYALMLATLLIVPAFRAAAKGMPPGDRHEAVRTLASRVLTLGAQGPAGVVRNIVPSLATAVCKMNKLFLEDDQGQAVVADIVRQAVPEAADLTLPTTAPALQLLLTLVRVVNTYESNRSATFMQFGPHRRASTGFRDASLRAILGYALALLQRVNGNTCSQEAAAAICGLVRACLTFDFMAIIVDETEDTYVTQYPSDWRDLLCSEQTLSLLGGAHSTLPPPLCTELLHGLVGLIGARRSFFETEDAKMRWLTFFTQQLVAVEKAGDGRLQRPEYCTVLAQAVQRFIPPHGYADLKAVGGASEFITFVANFSLTMFSIPFGQGSSFATTTYLMQFWSRLVNSKKMHGSPEDMGADIESYVLPMLQKFVTTRITTVDAQLDEDAVEAISAQADLLPSMIGLCLPECLAGIAQTGTECGANVVASAPSTMVWFCTLAAVLVKTSVQQVNEEQAGAASAFVAFIMDCVRCFQATGAAGRNSHVEAAVVAVLSALQHVFSGPRLSASLGRVLTTVFGDRQQLFQTILMAIGSNMMSTLLDPRVIRSSIELVAMTCRDMPASQLAAMRFDIPPVVDLPLSAAEHTYKLRTQLVIAMYSMRVPDPFDAGRFAAFMAPIDALLAEAPARLQAGHGLWVAGLFRDLRGVAAATNTCASGFGALLDWLVARQDGFAQLAAAPGLPGPVLHSMLKFLLQLVSPAYPSGRLPLAGNHSPAGIYLFKFVATLLEAILGSTVAAQTGMLAHVQEFARHRTACEAAGHAVVAAEAAAATPTRSPAHGPVQTAASPPPSETQVAAELAHAAARGQVAQLQNGVWHGLVKPLYVAVEIVARCVKSDFCPFGAMQLYGDSKFDGLFARVVGMVAQLPLSVLHDFAKASAAVAQMLRTLNECGSLQPFAALQQPQLRYLVDHCLALTRNTEEKAVTLTAGLNFLGLVSGCYPAVVKLRGGGGDLSASGASVASPTRSTAAVKEQLAAALAGESQLWEDIALAAMNVITLQERGLSPASAVVFPMFDADPGLWQRYAGYLLAQYPEAKRPRAQEALEAFTQDVTGADKFFSNAVSFRMAIRQL